MGDRESREFAPVDDQMRLLSRGAVDLVLESELRAKLERSRSSGSPLTVKAGFDPTPTSTWATPCSCGRCGSSRRGATG